MELVLDAKALPALTDHVMSPWEKVIPDVPWLKSLKRILRNDRIFIFRNHLTQTWVLAAWVYSPKENPVRPCCRELESFEGSPLGEGWPEGLLPFPVLVARLASSARETVQSRMEKAASRERDAKRKRLEDIERRANAAKWMKRKGLEEGAHRMLTGKAPVAYDPEMEYMWRDVLKTLAKVSD